MTEFAERFGGNSEFQWQNVDAIGSAGGMLTIWNKDKFNLIFTFSGDGFCGVHGLWL